MDINDLRAFIAIAEKGGFRAAANELFVSQPALSRIITRLERELDVVLFKRGPSGAVLTPQGASLMAGARRLVALAEDLRGQARSRANATIRLGTAPTSADTYMPSFLRAWLPSHPRLRVVLLNDGAARLRRRVEDGDCDAAIVAGPMPDSLESLPLTRVNVRAHFPPGHRLAHLPGPISVHELDGERLLTNSQGYTAAELLLTACNQVGSMPDIVYENEVSQTLAALAEAGLGIAVFAHSTEFRGHHLPNRIIVDGSGTPIGFVLYVAWRRGAQFDDEIVEFLQGLSAHIMAGAQ